MDFHDSLRSAASASFELEELIYSARKMEIDWGMYEGEDNTVFLGLLGRQVCRSWTTLSAATQHVVIETVETAALEDDRSATLWLTGFVESFWNCAVNQDCKPSAVTAIFGPRTQEYIAYWIGVTP